MSRLEELIQQYCPDGVEYIKLGDIEDNGLIKLGRGNVISKQNMKECPGDYPVYSSSCVGDGEIGRYGKYMFDDERISWSIDGGGKFFYRNNLKYSITNVSGWLKVLVPELVSAKYLYYSLTNEWVKKVYDYTHKAHPSVIREEYVIPLPPLPVQEEIVRILDTLTELQAELQAELQKRLQQYNYYRDKLLLNFTPEQDAKEYYLEEITTDIYSGATPSKEKREFWENGTIPWMSSGEVNLGKVYDVEGRITQLGYDKCSTKMVPQGSVVIALAGQGKTRGTVALLKTTVCTNQSLAALVPNTKMVLGEYLYHYLRTQYMKLREVSAGDGTRGGLNLKMLRSYKVIIPPMEEQQRIVDILERFDALTTDITAGLPAEIEARRKQYEYYRDQLLTFRECRM